MPLTDEDCDRLIASRDPIDASVLDEEAVAGALRRLHEIVLEEQLYEVQPRVDRRRRAGRRLGVSGRRLVALAGILVASLGAVLAGAALLPASGPQGDQLEVAPAAAAVVLGRAAQTAMRAAPVVPGPRQYAFLRVQTRSVLGGGPSSTGPGPRWNVWTWQTDVKSDWYRANGSGRERIVRTGTGFLTSTDRAVARAHGLSLAQVLPPTPRILDGAFPRGALESAGFLPYWRLVSPGGMPTAPHALLRAFERMLASLTPSGPGLARANPTALFGPISQFLLLPASPRLRAALYRVLAELPRVRLLGWKHDRLGRRGLAVGVVEGSSRFRVREELLFDPATSEVLETRTVDLHSARVPNTPPMPAGTVIDDTEFISRGLVNLITQLPGGGHLPLPSGSAAGAVR